MISEGWSNILNKLPKYYFQKKPGTRMTMEENRNGKTINKETANSGEKNTKTRKETKILI